MNKHNPYRNVVPDELYDELVHAEHAKPVASGNGPSCITIAAKGGYISIQDDKLDHAKRQALTQVYTPEELAAFVADAKAGRYDHLI